MKRLFLTLIMFFCLVGVAMADSIVTFQWDANTEANLQGYRLYQSDTSGQYVYGMNLPGTETNHIGGTAAGTETFTTTVADGTWFWVVTAHDTDGYESGPSNEVTRTLPVVVVPTPPDAPSGFRITIVIDVPQ